MQRLLRLLTIAAMCGLLWWPPISAAQTGERAGGSRFEAASARVTTVGLTLARERRWAEVLLVDGARRIPVEN